MYGKKLIPLKEIDLRLLPQSNPLDAVTLYNVIERGVKNTMEPWKFAQYHEDLTDIALQKAFDKEIEERTNKIMTVIISELFL